MPESINFITYIPPVKPESQAQGCILQRSIEFNPLGENSPARIWGNSSTSRGMRICSILAQVITGGFCSFSHRAIYGIHSRCIHKCVVRLCGHMRCPCVCVYCLCLVGRVSFSTRVPVQSLTTVNQRRT